MSLFIIYYLQATLKSQKSEMKGNLDIQEKDLISINGDETVLENLPVLRQCSFTDDGEGFKSENKSISKKKCQKIASASKLSEDLTLPKSDMTAKIPGVRQNTAGDPWLTSQNPCRRKNKTTPPNTNNDTFEKKVLRGRVEKRTKKRKRRLSVSSSSFSDRSVSFSVS